ncbi:MAG TPA: hypothetical protein EYQ44_03245, partial [Porticoccaceae bacterium]|nr:hypothetical protein [Porticoccaceae bacterium]
SGHSMGAYGAFRLGLNHSDIFNSFAAHSGPIHLESLNNPFLINAILIESFFGPLDPDNGSFSMMMLRHFLPKTFTVVNSRKPSKKRVNVGGYCAGVTVFTCCSDLARLVSPLGLHYGETPMFLKTLNV